MAKTTKIMDAELQRLFTRFDVNKDGHIDEIEFGLLLQALDHEISSASISLQFAVIDANEDGVVDYQEFVDWWLDHTSL
ncbi:MAG: EF-hand domain-containing protein [Gammaproteobacteria bacterium]